jgi:predicted CopG family antitoxin
MANLQIKGIKDDLYAQLGKVAVAENRSISQQVLFLIKRDLARRKSTQCISTPAETLLELSGSWEGKESASELITGIRAARKNSAKLEQGI